MVYGDLDVVGVVRARQFTQYSDVRLKTNIEDLVDVSLLFLLHQLTLRPCHLSLKCKERDMSGNRGQLLGKKMGAKKLSV